MSQNIQGDVNTFTLGRKILFVILALAITFGAFYFAKPNVVEASKKNGKAFGSWTVSCSTPQVAEDASEEDKKAAEEATFCMLTHTVLAGEEDKKQPVAAFQFGYYGENKELRMVQILPLGVSIPAGTSIVSGDKLIARGVYSTCLNSGCQAIAPISDEDLKTIIENEKNAVAILGLDGNQINIEFDSKGLDKGLQFLKK